MGSTKRLKIQRIQFFRPDSNKQLFIKKLGEAGYQVEFGCRSSHAIVQNNGALKKMVSEYFKCQI